MTAPSLDTTPATALTALVDVVIPVHNEEADLRASVGRLCEHLAATLPYRWQITVVDNASTDSTWQIAQHLAAQNEKVHAVHLDAKGRGRALRQVWSRSTADVVAYMDVDLSTDLKALLPLVAAVVSGHSDIAIGTRLSGGSRVVRGPKRELISRAYNLLLRIGLGAGFSDAQCGFKAVRRDVADRLLPLVEDNNWFFDTELLILAERAGLRIHEVPVDWMDDPGSSVDILATAVEDLRGIARLSRGLASGRIPVARLAEELARPTPPALRGDRDGLLGQLLRFGLVGLASTLAYFLLYLLLRAGAGPQAANLIALAITAVANTAANRRLTFGIVGRTGALRHHAGGLLAFVVALGITSGSLWALQAWWPGAGQIVEVVVLVVANAAATLLRFLALRVLMHTIPPGGGLR